MSQIPILQTRIHIPESPGKILVRTRLIDRLNSFSGRLVLAAASAGSGKTTLIRSWIKENRTPSAWVSLDSEMADPLRFLLYLAVSAESIIGDSLGDFFSYLESSSAPSPDTLVSLLGRALNESGSTLNLVLDDYHSIDSQDIQNLLTVMIPLLSPRITLVLITREYPGFPLGRLRIQGDLLEIGDQDLRFSREEIRQLFQERLDTPLSDEDFSLLESRTEGWAAGLQLAALSRSTENIPDLFQSPSVLNEYSLEYLTQEVLEGLPLSLHNGLLAASLPDRFCGELCDAMIPENPLKGRDMIEEWSKRNLFIASLDNEGKWFRFHHLFRDLLKKRLLQQSSFPTGNLYTRAVLWFEGQGLFQEAVTLAVEGDLFPLAAELLEKGWTDFNASFRSREWLGIARMIPEEELLNRPMFCLCYAWCLLDTGHIDEVESWLGRCEFQVDFSTPEAPVLKSSRSQVACPELLQGSAVNLASARAYLAQLNGDVETVSKMAHRILDLAQEDDFNNRGVASSYLAMIYWGEGDLVRAFLSLQDMVQGFEMEGNLSFSLAGKYAQAEVLIQQGELSRAEKFIAESLNRIEKQKAVKFWIAGSHLCLRARISILRGLWDSAESFLEESSRVCSRSHLEDWPMLYNNTLYERYVLLGLWDEAEKALDQAESRSFMTPMPQTITAEARRMELALCRGQLDQVRSWMNRNGITPDQKVSFLSEFNHILLARLMVKENLEKKNPLSLSVLLTFLERLLESSVRGMRTERILDIHILYTAVYRLQSREDNALESFSKALETAWREEYSAPFFQEAELSIEMLDKILTSGILEGSRSLKHGEKLFRQLSELKNNFSLEHGEGVLSPREQDILHLIERGFSNQDIAEELFISLSTVKGHNQNIFAKLGVKRRTEAVARARESGLLE